MSIEKDEIPWPPQRRSEDDMWFSPVRRYESIILLGIVVVMLVSSIMAWIDRRDNVTVIRQLNFAISGLSSQSNAQSAVLTRVEDRTELLSQQNARWVSFERELLQLREQTKDQQVRIEGLTTRIQRIEDRAQ